MPSLIVDFITSLDGYGAAEGWPGFWGLQGPEYLAWLGEQPKRVHDPDGRDHVPADVRVRRADAGRAPPWSGSPEPKVVFSSTLQPPLAWANTQLVGGDAVEAVRR